MQWVRCLSLWLLPSLVCADCTLHYYVHHFIFFRWRIEKSANLLDNSFSSNFLKGALTCSIIGLSRKVTTLVASIYIYGHQLNAIQALGLLLAVGSMIMNFMGKKGKKKGHGHGNDNSSKGSLPPVRTTLWYYIYIRKTKWNFSSSHLHHYFCVQIQIQYRDNVSKAESPNEGDIELPASKPVQTIIAGSVAR